MFPPEGSSEPSPATRQKVRVATLSAIATIVLVAIKAIVGWHTGSLAVLSEATDSAMDFVASLITFFAVRVADRPADREHQYGHAKAENLAALVQTLLLLATCLWIIYEALERMLVKHVEVEPSALAFGVILASIGVNVWRSRALARTAAMTGSQALEAGALNFRTDIWSSCTVLLGLAGVRAARVWGIPQLLLADAAAAVVVAVLVLLVGARLGKRAVDALLDRAPEALVDRIRAAIQSVPDVQGPMALRARTAGPRLFVDAAVSIGRSVSFETAHAIVTRVEERVREIVPEASVVIHAEPLRPPGESVGDAVRVVVGRHAAGAHDMVIYEADGTRGVDLHLELPGEMPLAEADDVTRRIAADLRREFPRLGPVQIHVDPVTPPRRPGPAVHIDLGYIAARLAELGAGIPGLRRVEDVSARATRDGLWVICRGVMDPGLTVREAHDRGRELARLAQAAMPGIHRLTVRAEAEREAGAGRQDRGSGVGDRGPGVGG